jgi:hypothetical protein
MTEYALGPKLHRFDTDVGLMMGAEPTKRAGASQARQRGGP